MKLMPQLQTEIPDPLRHHLPALLSPGGVAAPTIRVLFPILISQSRLKGPTMQIQLDDIGGGERPLWQIREEKFVDNARTCDAHRTFLFACGMGRYHHAARHALRSHRHAWTVVETAHHLALLSAAGTDL